MRSQSRTRRRGAAIIEASLLLPILFMLLYGIMEYGRFLFVQHTCQNACREGARYALTHTQTITVAGQTQANSDAAVKSAVTSRLGNNQLQSQNITIFRTDQSGNNYNDWTSASFGQLITVRMTGTYRVPTALRIMLPATIALQFQSQMRSEAN
jgi:Flp pilus assembly protein TadG